MIGKRISAAARQGGFTLMELLVAMILIGIMATLFSTVISSAVRQDAVISESSSLQTEVRSAVAGLSKELRQAYTGDDATPPIESMSATSIQFLSAGGGNPFPVRRVGYQLSSGNLQHRLVASTDTDGPPWIIGAFPGWTTIVGSVVNTDIFAYYDENGIAITNMASVGLVRTVAIKLTVQTKTLPPRQLTYTSSVTLRTP